MVGNDLGTVNMLSTTKENHIPMLSEGLFLNELPLDT